MSDIKKVETPIVTVEMIRGKIYVIRGQRVMLDFELAEIYGYSTSAFNQQVRNNSDKFDDDFRFQLTREEWKDLRAQKSTSRSDGERNPIGPISQNAISNTDFINAANLMSKNLTSSSEICAGRPPRIPASV